ncbi:hypothetical protein ACUIAK_07590 [Bacillus cytotoxicus]
MAVGIYIRVSTQEQASEGHSIESQKKSSLLIVKYKDGMTIVFI